MCTIRKEYATEITVPARQLLIPFQLIPSEENKRAVRLAMELLNRNQIMEERNLTIGSADQLSAPGTIGNEFDGISLAHKRKRAADDELEDLVEILRRN